MTRRTRLLALVAVPALALAACTSNDAKRSDVVDAMSDAGLTDDQAACVGDGFEAAFGDDQELFNDVAAAADTDEFPEGTEDQVREIIDGCVNGEGDGGTETTGATDGTETTGATDGTETTETTATTAG